MPGYHQRNTTWRTVDITGGRKMKRIAPAIVLITVLTTVAILAGCIPVLIHAGLTETREYNISDFTGIEIGHAFKIDITPSDKYSIAITAGENVFKYIDVYKSGNTLKIEVKGLHWPFVNTKLEAKITMPEIHGLNLSGAAQGNAKGFKSSQDFSLMLSGASTLDMDMEAGSFKSEISGASKLTGSLKASSSSIELSGASNIKLKGSGGNILIDGSGASHFELTDFTANDADIELSGASHASLDISGKMDVSLSGASSLRYAGNPTMGRLDITGASDIKQLSQ
jgi:hypothetical protein